MPSKDPIKGKNLKSIISLPVLPVLFLLIPLRLSSTALNLLSFTYAHSPTEIRGEVSQMVSVTDKVPIAVEKNKLLLPPNYTRYFMWGFPDYSARIATVEGDRVSLCNT